MAHVSDATKYMAKEKLETDAQCPLLSERLTAPTFLNGASGGLGHRDESDGSIRFRIHRLTSEIERLKRERHDRVIDTFLDGVISSRGSKKTNGWQPSTRDVQIDQKMLAKEEQE